MGMTAGIVMGAVVLLMVIAVMSVVVGGRRRRQVRDLFGPEYDRPVGAGGDASLGGPMWPEGSPAQDRLDTPPLDAAAVDHYRTEWDRVQAGFVDRPALALHEADTLVTTLMGEQGFPVDSFEQRAAPTSSEHPEIVQRYRAARHVHLRADSSETTTDELRQAFVEYRDLLDELLRPDAGRTFGEQRGGGHQVRS